MANTKEIKTKIEPWVRYWLSTQYNGIIFSEKSVKLVTGGIYKCDAVSQDGKIMGAILSSRAKTSGRNDNTGGLRKASQDLTFLKLLPPNITKLMIFTDANFCELIKKRSTRQDTKDIHFLLCKLPQDLDLILNRILDEASREQAPKKTF